MTDFSQLGLRAETIEAVAATGYTTPTPIQEQAIPVALAGRDVLGIAQTGTGKTAAFTLPMIDRLQAGRARARMPRSLVLAPTRELADQVAASFDKYAKGTPLKWALLIGGVSFDEQLKALDRGVDVLIATPGRLLDLFERGKLMLNGVEIMVVDEADRMLDMGFIPDIERIFKLTPPRRQTLFFSATMPPEITRLTTQFLKDPTRIEASRPATTADTITQYVCQIPSADPKAKRTALRALIAKADIKNAIVFCNRKAEVDVVAKSLAKHGLDASPIHGDLDQSMRTRTLESFRSGGLAILVASDVAARGLDIPAVSHVFNYDVPHHADDYVHRIGRTGRAGRTGETFMIVTPADAKSYEKVLKLTKKEPEAVVLDVDWGAIESPDRDRSGRRDRERTPRRQDGERPASRRSARPTEAIATDDGDFGRLADETPGAAAAESAPAPRPAREPRGRADRSNTESSRRREPHGEPRAGQAGDRGSSERGHGERGPGERNHGERGHGERSHGERAQGDRAYGERSDGDHGDRGRGVVGFGADTPAFLLRTSRLSPKTAKVLELED